MIMSALHTLISQQWIERLGWMLIHFVWQAVVVAVLLALMLRLLRRSSSNIRYAAACAALVLIIVLPLVTMQLIVVTRPVAEAGPPPFVPAQPVMPTEETVEFVQVPAQPTPIHTEPVTRAVVAIPSVPLKDRLISHLAPALPCIVLGWLIGVFGLSAWHLGGWAQLQRFRRRMVRPVSDAVRSRVTVLAERLGVHRAIGLLESALVEVPTVVGWIKPVILLPASALTGLSGEQLEAILAHELAHIRRYDYLVNILQTIVEILGFYHPALWWVSHRIRIERENCCDDLAVKICGDSVQYARALTHLEEMRHSRTDLAVAADGGSLTSRIARLLGRPTPAPRPCTWLPGLIALLLAISVIILVACGVPVRASRDAPDGATTTATEPNDTMTIDSIFGSSDQTAAPQTGRRGRGARAMRPTGETDSSGEPQIRIEVRIAEILIDQTLDPDTAAKIAPLLERPLWTAGALPPLGPVNSPAGQSLTEMLRTPFRNALNLHIPRRETIHDFLDLLVSQGYAEMTATTMVTVNSSEPVTIGTGVRDDPNDPMSRDMLRRHGYNAMSLTLKSELLPDTPGRIRLAADVNVVFPSMPHPGDPTRQISNVHDHPDQTVDDGQWVRVLNHLVPLQDASGVTRVPIVLVRPTTKDPTKEQPEFTTPSGQVKLDVTAIAVRSDVIMDRDTAVRAAALLYNMGVRSDSGSPTPEQLRKPLLQVIRENASGLYHTYGDGKPFADFLISQGYGEVLSHPTAVVSVGETTRIVIGQDPNRDPTPPANGSEAFGLALEVTPTLPNGRDTILYSIRFDAANTAVITATDRATRAGRIRVDTPFEMAVRNDRYSLWPSPFAPLQNDGRITPDTFLLLLFKPTMVAPENSRALREASQVSTPASDTAQAGAVLRALTEELGKLDVELVKARQTMTESHPTVVKLKNLIEALDKRIVEMREKLKSAPQMSVRQQYVQNDPRMRALNEEIAKYEVQLVEARRMLGESHPELVRLTILLEDLRLRLASMQDLLEKEFDRSAAAHRQDAPASSDPNSPSGQFLYLSSVLRVRAEKKVDPQTARELSRILDKPLDAIVDVPAKQVLQLIADASADQATAATTLLSSSGYVEVLTRPSVLGRLGRRSDVTIGDADAGGFKLGVSAEEVKDKYAVQLTLDLELWLMKALPARAGGNADAKDLIKSIETTQNHIVLEVPEGKRAVQALGGVTRDASTDPNSQVLYLMASVQINKPPEAKIDASAPATTEAEMTTWVYALEDPSGRSIDAEALKQKLLKEVEPGSWKEAGGKGQILLYPEHAPRKMAVAQTPEIHTKIREFVDRNLIPSTRAILGSPAPIEPPGVKAPEYDGLYISTYYPGRDASGQPVDAEALRRRLLKEVEPHSWKEAGGRGEIVIYAENQSIGIIQTPEILHEIEEFLTRDLNSGNSASRTETPVPADTTVDTPVTLVYSLDRDSTREPVNVEALRQKLLKEVEPRSWKEAGGQGTIGISTNPPAIIVTQTHLIHRRVQEFLVRNVGANPTVRTETTSADSPENEDKAWVDITFTLAKVNTRTVLDRRTLILIGTAMESDNPQAIREIANIDPAQKTTLGDVLSRYVVSQSLSQQTCQTLIDLLRSRQLLELVANPKITAVNDHESEIRNIQEEWFMLSGNKVEFKNSELQKVEYGTNIKVTPHIEPDKHITLQLAVKQTDPSPGRLNNGLPAVHTMEVASTVTMAEGKCQPFLIQAKAGENGLDSLLVACSAKIEPEPPVPDGFVKKRVSLNYQTPERVMALLPAAWQKYVWIRDPHGHIIRVTAPPELADDIVAKIRALDVRPRGVLLTARVVTLPREELTHLGLEWMLPRIGTPFYADRGGPDGIRIGYSPEDTLPARLDELGASGRADIVAKPEILAMDGHAAELLSINREWFMKTGIAPGANPDTADPNTLLTLTPRIADNNDVQLEVAIEVRDLIPPATGSGKPVVTRQQTQNLVTLPNGGTAVAGFRRDRATGATRDTAIFITARIVPEGGVAALQSGTAPATHLAGSLLDVLRSISRMNGVTIMVDATVKPLPVDKPIDARGMSAATAIEKVLASLQGTPYRSRQRGDAFLIYKPITATFTGDELPAALDKLAALAGVPIVMSGELAGKVTAAMSDVTLEEAFDMVLTGTPYLAKRKADHYEIVEPRM
jgi:beta-lactamase regulating signal transducer with metallopeptidase domain